MPRVRESYKRPFIGSISAIATISGLGAPTIQILLPACAPIHREVSMSTFTSFSTVRPHKIWAGAVARAVQGVVMDVEGKRHLMNSKSACSRKSHKVN